MTRKHVSLAAWRDVHAVNLDGTLLGCQAAIAAMKGAARGSIINIASRSGLVGIPGAARLCQFPRRPSSIIRERWRYIVHSKAGTFAAMPLPRPPS